MDMRVPACTQSTDVLLLSLCEPLADACKPLPKEEACVRLVRATRFPFPW